MIMRMNYGARNIQRSFLFALLVLANSGCAHAQASRSDLISCSDHPEVYASRSAELQKIVDADQSDRQGSPDKIDWAKVGPRDLERLARIAEIFAEGCFKEAKDYAAAALVYQHGQVPDHYFQTFIWGKKAVDLGDPKQKWITVAGLDRYLVHSGQKQLFATQFGKDSGSPCWCLESVEESFPEDKRIEWAKLSVKQEFDMLKSYFNKDQKECAEVQYCRHVLKPTPKGSVPGFW
jgi:hypothetical protein